MPVDHYENFPVVFLLLPRHLREPVEAVYAYAPRSGALDKLSPIPWAYSLCNFLG